MSPAASSSSQVICPLSMTSSRVTSASMQLQPTRNLMRHDVQGSSPTLPAGTPRLSPVAKVFSGRRQMPSIRRPVRDARMSGCPGVRCPVSDAKDPAGDTRRPVRDARMSGCPASGARCPASIAMATGREVIEKKERRRISPATPRFYNSPANPAAQYVRRSGQPPCRRRDHRRRTTGLRQWRPAAERCR